MNRAWRGSPLAFLFVAVFVDMVGYGLVVPAPIAGLAFDHLGVPAPYWIGALLSALALLVAVAALLANRRAMKGGIDDPSGGHS